MFKKPVWHDLSFVTWCIILLEVAIRRWVHCSHKGMNGQQQYSGSLWCLNNAQLVLKGPKCTKKISSTPLHHHQQPEPLRQGTIDPCFHVLYAKFWPSECRSRKRLIRPGNAFTIFYCPILVSLCELLTPFPVLSWQERHPVWSSAAVAHLLQGSTCCVFRDGILYTLVVTSGYLSYCCLSIIFNQSAHSPQTSTRHFRAHNCRSLDIFSFSDHSL